MIMQLETSVLVEEQVEEQIEEVEKIASMEHGRIGVLLSSHLVQHTYPQKLGEVFDSQTTFKVAGTPSHRQPDVAFVSAARLPENLRRPADIAPDLAVEIISENDKTFEVEAKVVQYQESGIPLVWVVYPVTQTVEIYRLTAGLRSQRLWGDDELSGEDVIPGFRLAVKKLFE